MATFGLLTGDGAAGDAAASDKATGAATAGAAGDGAAGDRAAGDGAEASAADSPWAHHSADVDSSAELGPRTRVWHLAQVRENARLGQDCIVGRGAYVGPGVVIGDQVKLQNYALVYEPARLEDQVFIGPAAVLTNDVFPRATDAAGKLKRPADWEAFGVVVRCGASVGARAVVLPGVVIGRWALVGAGAVVTRDVGDFAMVAGVPARRIGWVGRAGSRLLADGAGQWRCPETGEKYQEADGALVLMAGSAAR
jgi:acetyltransferase-like isoleucine patch superfamily enzyme